MMYGYHLVSPSLSSCRIIVTVVAWCWCLLAPCAHSFPTFVSVGTSRNQWQQHDYAISVIRHSQYESPNNPKYPLCQMNLSNNKNDDDDDDDEDTIINQDIRSETSTNVLGTSLIPCCTNVRNTGIGTGFYRNGYCSTGDQDLGRHTVCVQVTDTFLQYSKSVGNDLSTPVPEYMFPGLQEGDIWCLCAQRWAQAYNAGKAPKLYLSRTHEKTLTYVPLKILQLFAIDGEEAEKALQELNDQRDRLNKLL